MPDFIALPINTEGFGPYHLNRFRIGLRREGTRPAALRNLATALANDFERHIQSRWASVSTLDSTGWDGRPLYRFVGMASLFGGDTWVADVLVPDFVHDDHVGVVQADWGMTPQIDREAFPVPGSPGVYGFTAQTLKRVNSTWTELGAKTASIGGGVAGALAVDRAIEINKRHFLAGRRSWRVGRAAAFGYAAGGFDYVLETAAIERFSHVAFAGVDASGIENFYGSEGNPQTGKVTNVWCSMLKNFRANVPGIVTAYLGAGPTPGWYSVDGVEFQYARFAHDNRAGMEASAMFAEITRLHADIYPR